MRSIDTNILVRWLLRDDSAQRLIARSLLTERVQVTTTVMLELGWVLGKVVKLPRDVVADMLQQVVDLETVVTDHPELLTWAIERYRNGADWGDVVHLCASRADAEAFATFDRALPREAGPDSPIVVEVLRA